MNQGDEKVLTVARIHVIAVDESVSFLVSLMTWTIKYWLENATSSLFENNPLPIRLNNYYPRTVNVPWLFLLTQSIHHFHKHWKYYFVDRLKILYSVQSIFHNNSCKSPLDVYTLEKIFIVGKVDHTSRIWSHKNEKEKKIHFWFTGTHSKVIFLHKISNSAQIPICNDNFMILVSLRIFFHDFFELVERSSMMLILCIFGIALGWWHRICYDWRYGVVNEAHVWRIYVIQRFHVC